MLQCVAVSSKVLPCAQYVVVRCSVSHCVVVCCIVLQSAQHVQRVAVWCRVLQCIAVCCSVLQCVAFAVCCIVLRSVCSALQCVAVHCSALQCVAVCSRT